MNPNLRKADKPEGPTRWARIAMTLVFALLLCLAVVRNAFVAAYTSTEPVRAAKVWPGHPSVVLEAGLSEVGRRAAAGERVEPALVLRLINSYPRTPLAPETFLVRGVQAELAGNEQLSGQAFIAARDRNPRGIAARYFLADHYLRANRTPEGLEEISALVRLVPQSLPSVAPYLAAYARQKEAAPRIKAMVRSQPKLEAELLGQLASDPANFDLILYLWTGQGGGDAIGWQTRLINGLVAAGQFDKARAAWTRFTGITPVRDRLFDPDFTAMDRPPFGWTLVSGPSGVAEPQGSGRLHIIYYGREDMVLASQLLLLTPGRFNLSMRVNQSSGDPEPLRWVVRCLPTGAELLSVPVASIGREGTSGTFQVPPNGCSAQALEFIGRAPEFPQQVDLTLSELKLEREAAQ